MCYEFDSLNHGIKEYDRVIYSIITLQDIITDMIFDRLTDNTDRSTITIHSNKIQLLK